ncbi:MAG: hypothetical protein R3A45_05280 [Bdellovibrionota bacterium]
MGVRKLELLITEIHQNKRLDQALSEWLSHALRVPVSRQKSRSQLAGAVYLNKKRVRIASKPLLRGARKSLFTFGQHMHIDLLYRPLAQ